MKPILNVTQLTFGLIYKVLQSSFLSAFRSTKMIPPTNETKTTIRLQSNRKIRSNYVYLILKAFLWSAGYIDATLIHCVQLTLTSYGIVSDAIMQQCTQTHHFMDILNEFVLIKMNAEKKISISSRNYSLFSYSDGKRREIGIWFEPTTDFDDSSVRFKYAHE